MKGFMRKIRAFWQSTWGTVDRRVKMGRVLGLLFITAGFVVIAKAWDGAASLVRVDSQMPYLLSGGFLGLGLIVLGTALLFLATVRAERELMTQRFDDMARLLGRNLSRMQFSSNGSTGTNGEVVPGKSTYHRAECRVLEGKDGLITVSVKQASSEGLTPCRVCDPPKPEEEPAAEPSTEASETPAR
jgi:hypothetical protein